MTDEKLRLQKQPGYRIYSPVPASGVRAVTERYEPYAKVFSSQGQRTNVEAVMQLHPTGSFVHFTVYNALAARLAEAERDAVRYRWLRIKNDDPLFWQELLMYLKATDFDACVDRGMADSASAPPSA